MHSITRRIRISFLKYDRLYISPISTVYAKAEETRTDDAEDADDDAEEGDDEDEDAEEGDDAEKGDDAEEGDDA